MKAKNKAFVSGILPRLPFLNDLISKVSSGSNTLPKPMEMLLSQKGPAYDLMSNEDRIQMERKELAKRFVKADNLYDPKLLQDREKTGSKRLSVLNQPGLSLVTDHLIDYPAIIRR